MYKKDQIKGIEIKNKDVYLMAVKEVMRGKIGPDGSFTGIRTIINDLPDGGQHANRTIKLGRDNILYITAGSTCMATRKPAGKSQPLFKQM